ncbi:cupin fold WbuC family metalloprotein [Desulfobaculum xiamenense]|uniref:Cupin fold WbuC family metalloprotein n=1 Tax=Desulfobaculum xiamenense TaxID=995050 RepID=A0A846QMH8_9BACT|nr:WbuC family cupin fold metalloprotein [Desulfobaculum xiamenense]NJB68387.1 cupin fold WbuC family metalloprotein [Desulfobaculum xiamenense]
MSGGLRDFPLALAAPDGAVETIGTDLVELALDASRRSPRGRIIQPLHRTQDDALHRMLNAVQPGSYVRPHRHVDPPKAESFVVLRGAIRFVTFSGDGQVDRCLTARAGGEVFGIDVVPGVYHCFYALEPDTLVFEVKPGPYTRATDKDFALWAPAEGTDAAHGYFDALVRQTME